MSLSDLCVTNVCSLTNRSLTDLNQSLELFQVIGLGLFFEENFNPIGSPDRNSGSEEVCILCPDRTGQRQGRSQNGPVLLIPAPQTLPRVCFKETVCLFADRLDQRLQIS